MSHTNFVVSGLTAYIEQSRDLLLKNILFGKGSRERMSIQTGVKYKEHLHIFDVDPVFGDGSDCGFSAAGTATLTERLIQVAPINVDMEICPKNLLGKYAEYEVRMAATENPLPFEEYLFDGIISGINRKIEKFIWLGDTSQSSDAVLKWGDGIVKLCTTSITNSTGVISTTMTGLNAYEGVMAVYNNLPEVVLEIGAEIFVSPAIFRAFVQSLVNLNLYHYNPGTPEDEVFIPGTNAKVIKTIGLAGSYAVVGTYGRNLVFGTDGENDAEVIDAWWSKDDRTWKLAIEFNMGVQIAFLDRVAYGAFSSAPASATSIAKGVADLSVLAGAYDSTNDLINVKDNA
ncbi:MAG: hypothetical protein IKY16_02930 [Bacteroidales bacterium]|nr:hypothetical protein [Bacteroidales bacterium]MBR5013543.1 hypothetical protein [Bacteroidales bacterium]